MTKTLKIAIAGLGTVGAGIVKILHDNKSQIIARTGRDIDFQIIAVSARDHGKDRGIALDSSIKWESNALDILSHNPDVVMECIGGSEGIALDLARQTLSKGVALITANKALLAHHGKELASLSETHNAPLLFEAAVGGGIPCIKALKEGLVANPIQSIQGILNGTSNFILTQMAETGQSFEVILKDAQDLGYAEADPSFDVDGMDAAHKLSILTACAFGVFPDIQSVKTTGIRDLIPQDLQFAAEQGYRLKLIARSVLNNGQISQSVTPSFVPDSEGLAHVNDVFNAVQVHSDYAGASLWVGRGAGQLPTASAMISDLVDIACGHVRPAFGVLAVQLKPLMQASDGDLKQKFYFRLHVLDEVGVLASLSEQLKNAGVSIEVLVQKPQKNTPMMICGLTHIANASSIQALQEGLEDKDWVVGKMIFIPVI